MSWTGNWKTTWTGNGRTGLKCRVACEVDSVCNRVLRSSGSSVRDIHLASLHA